MLLRNPASIRFALLFLTFALGGCSGGGGGTSGGGGTPVVGCITVHGGDCVTPEAFAESAAQRASAYRSIDGFRNQWGLEHIKADVAYSHLELLKGSDAEPGAGVTLGFIDSGIDLYHPMFAGKNVVEEFTPGAVDETGIDDVSHGTAVASIAAGARLTHSRAPHGLAWGADVVMFALTLSSGDGTYSPIRVEDLAGDDAEAAALYTQALSWRDGSRKVDILNLSLGYQGLIDRYTEQELRNSYGNTIAALAQADAEEKAILVWAAGNSHGNTCDPSISEYCRDQTLDAVSPGILAGLPAFIEELRGHSIAVAALSPADGEIASFSNRCGIAADFCIAAPGDEVRIAYFGPYRGEAFREFATAGGTSFAAPMVAGGLAIMKQLFRDQLSNTELVTRLFETADRSGVYADASIYGRGSMDLGAATSPVGVLELPAGTGVGEQGFRLLSTSISPGTALGDGLRRSLASREVMALDRLGAPFWYRLGDFAGSGAGPSVTARLRGFLAPEGPWPGRGNGAGFEEPGVGRSAGLDQAGSGRGAGFERTGTRRGRLGAAGNARGGVGEPRVNASAEASELRLHAERVEVSAESAGSHMALAEGGVRATLAGPGGLSAAAFTSNRVRGGRPVVGAVLGWRRAGSPVGVRAGWIGERKTLLGSVGEGAFSGLGADTSFVGLDAHTEMGAWRVGASAELGMVAAEAGGGWVERVSSLATSAFGLHASRALGRQGRLRLSVSQPLRVERGQAHLRVPVSRTRAGTVQYDALGAALAPSGRQLDMAGEWHRALGPGELRLGAVYSHRPGHRRDAAPELTFLAGWRQGF